MSDEFPYLSINDFYTFPDPKTLEDDEGIVGVGGNLSPGMLFSAYYQGIFPWYDEEPILWWSLNPRLILLPENLVVTKSMRKLFKKRAFHVTLDKTFSDVIKGCSNIVRSHEDGTWITDEIIKAYTKLHEEGFAHSVEVWNGEGKLCGGLYGVSIGGYFAGESMFALESNSSKYGFITLALFLEEKGFKFIDCQQETQHLMSLGAKSVKRDNFYKLLNESLNFSTYKGNWGEIFTEFQDFDPLKRILGV
ncbi:leucyl/phenylalanyl-tRNA--protein transferase [Thiospirochaeta perfilievii]|uniref:leucyl/phenylalanyl-tRNA--protein transferase n=1 Tax=Thiospirochaeta perfilievii TaxID=252967 RepID=UPI001FEF494E|nr:leucyl/phenylalanyl-tRNA--protein transferase [Thiospirochaeta perfilievii]